MSPILRGLVTGSSRAVSPRTLMLLPVLLCLAGPEPAAAQLRLTVVASGLQAPVAVIQDPTNPAVQFVVQRAGTILPIDHGVVVTTPFLDLTALVSLNGEGGLLGLAFAPDYLTSRRFFVHFTDRQDRTVIARFMRTSGDPLLADPTSRRDLVWPSGSPFIVTPFTNHRGGTLRFGPDNCLYIGLGDGGSGNDPFHNAQNPHVLLGKMLRVDVGVPDADPRGYRIPAGNPFDGTGAVPALAEIWAFGLRNPWKFSFDDPRLGGTGALLIGDVGQSAREEVDYQPPGVGGLNYGWRNFEGNLPGVAGPNPPPAYHPLTFPIFDYGRDVGGTVVGGWVYRGRALGTAFTGRYVFADDLSRRLGSLGLTARGGQMVVADAIDHTAELGGSAAIGSVVAIDVDAQGELLIVDINGRILKLGRADSAAPLVTTQPDIQSVFAGGVAAFGAAATGIPVPIVQWQQSVNTGASWTDIAGAISETFSFTAAAFDSGKQFRAVFTNSVGSAASAAATLTVSPAPAGFPGVPSGLVGLVSGSVVTLEWNAPSTGGPPTGYIVEAGSRPGLNDIASIPTGSAATIRPVSGVAIGTYFVRVRSTNGAGTSAPSNEAIVPVGPLPPLVPGAPSSLTSAVLGSSVTLSWTAPATGGLPITYVVEAGTGPGLADLANFSTLSTETAFTAGGVGTGSYYVRVRAANGTGTSGPSNEVVAVVVACSGGPESPTGLHVVSNAAGAVVVAWTAPGGALSIAPSTYVLEVGTAAGLANLVNTDLGSLATSFSATGVGTGTYFVRIRAKNACGVSLPSNEIMLVVS
jgi:glucose/arabinose dehydrogenase